MEILLLSFAILFVYLYAFVSGFTDAANAIATSIGTRALSPKSAVLMAGVLETVGALTGTAVALTIGKGIVDPSALSLTTVTGAIIGAITWSLFTYRFGIPVSETHGLIGGLVGAAVATTMGFEVIKWSGLNKVLLAIVASPILGFLSAVLFMKLIYRATATLPPHPLSRIFLNLQKLSAGFMAFSHGRNDAQKPMGILVLILTIFFGWNIKEVTVPLWVILSVGIVAGLGMTAGGWRIIKTLGMKVTSLRPEQGFAAETSAAGALQIASFFGIPVSTTHTITSSIIGAGSARRFSLVQWSIVKDIVISWILTLPVTILLGGLATLLLKMVF